MAVESTEEDEKPLKVDKWDGSAVKNALDDAAKKILLDTYGYEEDFTLIDGRLSIAFIACMFAMFALVWDYFNPFPQSKSVLTICALSYFVLMVVLTLYIGFLEKGCFLVALDTDAAGVDPSNLWKLSSSLKRYDDQYSLLVQYRNGTTREEKEETITHSVAKFFDENGVLCFDLYEPVITKLHSQLCASGKGVEKKKTK